MLMYLKIDSMNFIKSYCMLSSKYMIPECSCDSKSSVTVSVVMFHVISLQLSQNKNVNFRAKVEIVVQAII